MSFIPWLVMHRNTLVLIAWLVGLTDSRAQVLLPDKALEIELKADDPVLAGHGPSRTFDYEVTSSGTLHVWAASKDFDPILRITDSAGVLLAEDDNSGGGTTAYVWLGISRDTFPSIIVASADARGTGKFIVHASAMAARNHADLESQRVLVGESDAARSVGDYATARRAASEAVEHLLARPAAEQEAAWLELLSAAGQAAWLAQDSRTANSAWKRVYEVSAHTLPDEHPVLQAARQNLAITLEKQGDFAGARALEEKVLEVESRTLPDDHPDLQLARQHLANTLYKQGDLAGARALEKKVLEVRSRTLPDDDPALQAARQNFAITLETEGDLAGAHALEEKVLEVQSRTLPDDHPDLQMARLNLANTLGRQGDLAGARALYEKVLEVFSRTLPGDHFSLQAVRQNLAATLREQGDLVGARLLEEKVLDVFSVTLSDDHPDLQLARQNLANTLYHQGDVAAARALQEKALEVRSRMLPDDHPDLQAARVNLAVTLYGQGDLVAARALQEKVLEVESRTLPDDHPELQVARSGLANTLYKQGDFDGARALREKVLEVFSRTLPDEHPALQVVRLNLAITLQTRGDLAAARALEEKVLEVRSRTLPGDHPDLQTARRDLATVIAAQLAREHRSSGGEGEKTSESDGGRERCAELIGAVCRAQMHAARAAILASPAREAEERCASLAETLDVSLSCAQGYGVFEPLAELEAPSFMLAEATQGAALASAELTRRAAHSPKYAALRETLRSASEVLADLTQKGTTSEGFDRARMKRESAERELMAFARELYGGEESGVELDVESLAARLGGDEAAVSFRRFKRWRIEVADEFGSTDQPGVRERSLEHLCAFVVRSSKPRSDTGAGGGADVAVRGDAQHPTAPTSLLSLIDLGPIAPIEDAVSTWRAELGVGHDSRGLGVGPSSRAAGAESARSRHVRELVFDPIARAAGDATHLVLVLDDVLHLVPVDALAVNAEGELVGDRWQIETRATLKELLIPTSAPSGMALVALGGASFDAAPVSWTADDVALRDVVASNDTISPAGGTAPIDERTSVQSAALLRGTNWERGFAPLTRSGDEARGIGALYTEIYADERPALVLEKRKASREGLEALAPKARFVHIATHGWFAPESIRSWSDPEPLDKQTGLGTRMSGAEQVRGMSPMLLCGLALAGANMPETATGRTPGLITADELSTLDLSNCELAVLSACDTNVGERRAGQGVASLQKALQMAGARSVITSLWKVPDEATKELMLDFYRRLWVEKKPKHQALWEAKTKLREAKDERGAPKYTTRDWAAWVLTGSPE